MSRRLYRDEQLAAIARVLELVDGYLSTMEQETLYAYLGGMMTIGELRTHLQSARLLSILPPPKKAGRRPLKKTSRAGNVRRPRRSTVDLDSSLSGVGGRSR